MTSPAVLTWSRSGWRVFLAGSLALVGIATAVSGWIVMLAGEWLGAALIAVGGLLVAIAEPVAHRLRVVTAHGLRWERTLGTERLGWHEIGLTTRQHQAPPAADTPDRIVVHRRDGSRLEWPTPAKHGACVETLRWWHAAQQGFPRGDFRAAPGLRPIGDGRTPRRVHNLLRRWWQGVLGVLLAAAAAGAVGAAAVATARMDPAATAAGWGLAAAALAWAAGASFVNVASSASVAHGTIVHRRGLVRREVPLEHVAGVYVRSKPHRMLFGSVGFPALIVVTIVSLFDGGSAFDDIDSPGHRLWPTLLLRDGSAVELRALATRSEERARRIVGELAG